MGGIPAFFETVGVDASRQFYGKGECARGAPLLTGGQGRGNFQQVTAQPIDDFLRLCQSRFHFFQTSHYASQTFRQHTGITTTFGQMLGLELVVIIEKVRQVAHVSMKLEGHSSVRSYIRKYVITHFLCFWG